MAYLPKKIFAVLLLFLVVILLLAIPVINQRKNFSQKPLSNSDLTVPSSNDADSAREESVWDGKKTSLFQGQVVNFNQEKKEIVFKQEEKLEVTIRADGNTRYLISDNRAVSPEISQIDEAVFWDGLREDEKISVSCYDDRVAAFIVKIR